MCIRDRNLGNYINSVTNRNMLLWDGACHVHEQFSVEKIVELPAGAFRSATERSEALGAEMDRRFYNAYGMPKWRKLLLWIRM